VGELLYLDWVGVVIFPRGKFGGDGAQKSEK
jgi:hypothetical protein